MLTGIEQTRMDRLIYLVGSLSNFIKDEKEVIEYIRAWGGPDLTIKLDIEYFKETFEYKNYPESMYDYNDLESLSKMCEKLIIIVKDEIYYMMKADYDKGWIKITDENYEEITEQLCREISQEIDAQIITEQILKDIKK